MTKSEQYNEEMLQRAKEVYAAHNVLKKIAGGFEISRVKDSAYRTFITAPVSGLLVICGDIETVVLKGGGGVEDKWLWCAEAHPEYIAEKAALGMNVNKYSEVVRSFNHEVLLEELVDDAEDCEMESDRRMILTWIKAHQEVPPLEGWQQGLRKLQEDLVDYGMGERGLVVAPRIYYAKAALMKLLDLRS